MKLIPRVPPWCLAAVLLIVLPCARAQGLSSPISIVESKVSGFDFGGGIAVDSAGKAYVTGSTGSTNFPTSNPFQPTNHGSSNAFVAVIAP